MPIPTLTSLLKFYQECNQIGWPFPDLRTRSGDADICRARNSMIGLFLKSDCTDLVMIDGDISWGDGALVRLIEHDASFVGGAYRMRSDDVIRYPVVFTDPRRLVIDEKSGYPLIEVAAMPLGFCRIRRDGVELLVNSIEGRRYEDPMCPDDVLPWLIDFEQHSTVQGRIRMEEGYALCNRWRHLGGHIWLDPAIKLGHTGLKTFDGDVMAEMEKEMQQSLQAAE